MLSRFCNLCNRTINTSFISLTRRYGKAAHIVRLKKKNVSPVEDPEKWKHNPPIITCKRGAFNLYQGQTYSKKEVPTLASAKWDHPGSKGDYFFIYPNQKTLVEDEEANEVSMFETFRDFNLNTDLCDRLESLDIVKPLQIQCLAIPKLQEGRNVVIAAETGCGKTLAYLLPLIDMVLRWKKTVTRGMNSPLALIVTPTRELAVQIGLEVIKLSNHLGVRTKIFTGGKTRRMMNYPSIGDLDIVVASFGVISKLTSVRIQRLKFVRQIVLDEADALFHETFQDKVNVFMRRIPIGPLQTTNETGFPNTAQLIMTSATMPARLSQVLEHVVNLDSLEYVTTKKLHHILVTQKFMRVGPGHKSMELLKYVKPKVARKEPVIIFCNTNASSQYVSMFLTECGIHNVNLNGTMPLRVRIGKYSEFINGKAHVLSTTNAGSRGLDTIMVNHILNFDFPLDTADYIHRCGRTGRVGTTGDCRVTNFISKKLEVALVRKIERAVRKNKPIPIFNILQPESEPQEEEPVMEEKYEQRIIEDLEEEDSIPY